MSENTMRELVEEALNAVAQYERGNDTLAESMPHVRAVLARADEMDKLAERMRWRTMESAPKDESEFEASEWSGDICERVSLGWWDGSEDVLDFFFCDECIVPTHWRPLPEPPKEGE